MKEIVIIGAGDFGKEVAWLIEDINKSTPTYIVLGFLDDDNEKAGQIINGYEVLGNVSSLVGLNKNHHACATVAMQDSDARNRIVDMFPDFDGWETLIHPSVSISETSSYGKGCTFCAGTNVSVNTIIGNQCLFNINATVGHDCRLLDYVSVMSGAVISGHVEIKEHSYLASNCTIVPGRKIGRHSKVGAGSVVLRNVKDEVTVLGVPANVVRI